MAIQINDPNLSGLTAIAGHGPGNLNIAPTGALGLQALQQGNAQQNAQRQQALELMQMRQQGGLQLGQQGILRDQMNQQGLLAQQQQALEQQKMAQQDSQFGASLGADREKLLALMGQKDREVGAEEYKTNVAAAMKAQEMEMKKLSEMSQEKIKEKGAFASYGLLAMKQAKTPEEAQQIRAEILKDAVASDHISKEEAAAASKMPLSQFQNSLMYKVMQFGAANDFAAMNKANQPDKPSVGTHVSFNEDGSINEISTDPTMAMKTDAQKDLKARELGMQQLAKIRDKFDPSQFTYAGRAGRGASAIAELSKGIPGVEQLSEAAAHAITGKNATDRGAGLQQATGYLNSVEQFFNTYRKDITGAAAAEKELERLRASFINSDLSPSQFKGALDQLVTKYTSEAEFNKNVLRTGLDTSPNNGLRQHLKDLGHSEADIDAYMKGK